MKKILSLLLAALFIMTAFCLAACGETPDETSDTPASASTAETTATNATKETSATAMTTEKTETTATSASSETTTAVTPAEPPKPVFDENNVVLSFAAMSDCHIGNGYNSTAKLKNALTQLKERTDLDALCFDGDMTDTGTQAQINEFKSTIESVYAAGTVDLFYAIGNHEHTGYSTDGSAATKRYYDTFGASYFENDLTDADSILGGNRHVVINGFHFISVEPYTYGSTSTLTYKKYPDATVTWLDETLAAIVKEDPDSYIFVLTHPMIYDTCYGSDLDGKDSYWNTTQLTPVLEKYPQVVVFGGHLHYPLNDERSIMQTDFTSVGCGSVSYMAIEAGGYVDMQSRTVMRDCSEYSEGLLIEVDASGAVRFTRLDFYREEEIKTAWIIPAPKADGSHLLCYTKERGAEANNEAPTAGEGSFTVTDKGSSKLLTLVFDSFTDDDFVHDYEVKFYRGGKLLFTRKILTDFYRNPDPATMKKQWSLDCGKLLENTEYSAEITAYDSWGVQTTLTVTYNGESGETGKTEEDATLPAAYADFSVSASGVTDTKGKITFQNSGATFEKAAVTLGSASASADVVRVKTAGTGVIATFNEAKTSSEMQSFMNKGFSVEGVFLCDGTTGKTQGTVCGTQQGGWGIALDTAGKLYACAYIGSTGTFYTAKAQKQASVSEYTHAVAVFSYDSASDTSTIALYINGELAGSASSSGTFFASTDTTACNKFVLGGDITKGGVIGDFPCASFSLSSGALYNTALNASQVKAAYEAAVSALK